MTQKISTDCFHQWIELSRSALEQNTSSLKRLAGDRKLAVCVKSNAYGHGLKEIVAALIDRPEVDTLTMHSISEARQCREQGWTRDLILLGPIEPDRLCDLFELDVQPAIFDKQTLNAIGKISQKRRQSIKTHLKLETGTNRQGISEKEIAGIASIYHKYSGLKRPHGASTHFANIEDTTNHAYALDQLGAFNHLVALMTKEGIKPTIKHTACSAALILFDKTRFDMVRPGISTYGYWPSKETYLSYRLSGGDNDIFKPVLSWRTRVTQIKNVPSESFVGYGCTYRTTAPSRLAVLPIGYFDGYARALSNRAYVLIKGKRAPVRGRICMNLTMVDITDIKGIKLGDPVTLIGSDGNETLTADALAGWSSTISYEILSRLSPSIPRTITS